MTTKACSSLPTHTACSLGCSTATVLLSVKSSSAMELMTKGAKRDASHVFLYHPECFCSCN